MSIVLTAASEALFRRAPEEQFPSWESLREAASSQRRACREIEARDRRILFSEDGETVHFADESVRMTHYSMGQFAALARVPMGVLQRLRPATRGTVLNQLFERTSRFKVGLAEGDRLRAVTSDRYERVWDEELLDSLDRWLLPSGFVPAVPTLGSPDPDQKPALFRSDRDSFFFLFSTQDPRDSFGGLRKGVVVYNSEVGAKCLGYQTFIFRDVCRNLLIWGASGVVENSAKHMGRVRQVFADFSRELQGISNQVSPLEYAAIDRATRTAFVESGREQDAAKRLQKEFGIPKALVPEVLEAVHLEENPGDLSVWGVVNGLTSVAKNEPYAADRVMLAAAAGALLEAR